MQVERYENGNAFILKRQGKFREALLAYARRFAKAQQERNEFIAQMCFDQMVDVQLLQLLKRGDTFSNVPKLKGRIHIQLVDVLREVAAFDDSFRKHLDRSWAKFGRTEKGRPLFSVGREQLVRSRSRSEDENV